LATSSEASIRYCIVRWLEWQAFRRASVRAVDLVVITLGDDSRRRSNADRD
jgi:hypothetical protein